MVVAVADVMTVEVSLHPRIEVRSYVEINGQGGGCEGRYMTIIFSWLQG
jgi:hypothetical protein